MARHKMIRPPAGAADVQRMDADGTWAPDDGRPGLAFSYKDGMFPMAAASECRCLSWDDSCPANLAGRLTLARWGCSNGKRLPAVRKAAPKGGG